ncbi:S24 family peptidase [Sphingobium chlorophenolicum]|nr:S24 family peptidase [Sphingobium chlorophenolicum]
MKMEHVRAFLDERIAERKSSYADISRLIGRNPAYIQQFIKRGTPRRLEEQDRRIIARFLGISEHLLSGFPLRETEPPQPLTRARSMPVPRLSLGASAGGGTLDIEERSMESVAIDCRWLQEIGVRPPHVSIIRVDGESMTPTLNHGDEIMVDHSDNMSRLRDGIYVLRLDDVLLVKRIAMGPRRDEFSIVSDNILYPSWSNVDPALVAIIGRVVWAGRIFR